MSMKAIITGPENTAVLADVPIPEPGPNEIRVKVLSIALNPVDALYVARPVDKPGRVVGSDVAGTVERVGEGVREWKVGDRVAGLLQGATSGNARPGGFAQYAILEADLAIRIPDSVSFDEAATFPLCALTAVQALFIRLELNPPFPSPYSFPAPTHEAPAILIYGASTSLGLFTLQLARLIQTPNGAPFKIIGTASPKNFAKVQAFGADVVYDYTNPDWPEKVKQDLGGEGHGIDYALDCISEGETTGKISKTFREGPGKIAVVRKVAWNKDSVKKDITPLYGAVWSGLGHEILYNGETLPADATWRQVSVEFFKWLSAGAVHDPMRFPIDANPVRLMPGGLESVAADGFPLLGYGDMNARKNDTDDKKKEDQGHLKPISGEKLVYRLGN